MHNSEQVSVPTAQLQLDIIMGDYVFPIVKSCRWLLSLLFNINEPKGKSGTEKEGEKKKKKSSLYGNVVLIATDITSEQNVKRSYLPLSQQFLRSWETSVQFITNTNYL